MNEPNFNINRRDLLAAAVTASAATVLSSKSAFADSTSPQFKIIDTNISLFQWPFRRLPLDDTELLVNKLRSLGVAEAWAGSFEGILHRNIASVNQRLADACDSHAELVPIGSINPELPGWEDDLDQCVNKHNMPGIRLHPNYHGYTLDDPRFAELLKRATAAGVFVQIAASMEDTRTQHPKLQVTDVDLSPLPEVVKKIPRVTVQILNYKSRPPLLAKLAATPGIFFEISRVDGTDGIAKLLRTVSPQRVMVGTHAPFFIPESVLIRILESNLSEDDLRLLLSDNAKELREKKSLHS